MSHVGGFAARSVRIANSAPSLFSDTAAVELEEDPDKAKKQVVLPSPFFLAALATRCWP